MGWGSKLIGIGKIGLGVGLTMTGAGAAAGVPLIASGGTDIINDIAREGSNKAIDKAVGQQQQATNQALGLQQQALTGQQQIYQQSQANLSPYLQLGGSGAQGVASMMGYPAITLPPIATGAPTGQATSQAPAPSMDVAVPREGAVRRPQAQDAVQTAQAQTTSSFGGTLGSLGPAVTLRAPTGQTMQFPYGDPNIPKALAMGAVQV